MKAQCVPTQQFGYKASVSGVKAIVGRSMTEVRFASVNRFHVVHLYKCYREKACCDCCSGQACANSSFSVVTNKLGNVCIGVKV
jgi:hypothetical protein